MDVAGSGKVVLKSMEENPPMCISGKEFRDDAGIWHQMKKYIQRNFETTISHGFVPNAAQSDARIEQICKSPDGTGADAR